MTLEQDNDRDERSPSDRLELLRDDILLRRLNRRSVLKRAMLLGLSAPVIAGLLAACGGDDDDEGDDATATSGGGQPATTATTAAEEPTEPTVPTDEPTEEGEVEATEPPSEASPTAATEPDTSTTPGHGRGVAELLRILYWQAPTNLNVHFSQGTKDSAAASLVLEPLILQPELTSWQRSQMLVA